MNSVDDSTLLEKVSVCGTSFACCCAAFFLSVMVLMPMTDSLFNAFGVPEVLTRATIFVELFGLPIVAAIAGISLASKPILQKRLESL